MYIASTSTTVKFHEFPSGNLTYNYKPSSINSKSVNEKSVKSISWCKDGSWLGLVPQSGFIEIISVKDQLKLLQIIRDIGEPTCISFQNNTKKNIAIGTRNGQILIYDIKSRNIKKNYPRIQSVFNNVEFTAKDSHLIASDNNCNVYVYSNLTNNLCSIYKISDTENITTLRTNPIKRNYIIAGSANGIVVVWDTNINKRTFLMNYHKAPVSSVAFSPINSELVLSTGLDRQFCFYDVTSNKCIANIAVDNNMTCADFSSDGSNFILGSQNGKIYIYDSRRIQEPVQVFQAHDNSIKCLTLQKIPETNTVDNSFYDISSSSECKIKQRNPPTLTPTTTTTANKSNSFNLTINTISGSQLFSNSPATINAANPGTPDSFLAAIQLDKSPGNSQTINETDGMKKYFDTKQLLKTPNPSLKKIDEKIFDEKLCQKSSTPKYLVQDSLVPPPSPIMNNANKIEAATKNVGNLDEFKKMLNDFKSEINTNLIHNFSEIRSICYWMQMANIKQFLKIENNFESFREELLATNQLNPNEMSLVQENLFLKQKLALLEQELSQIKNKKDNSE